MLTPASDFKAAIGGRFGYSGTIPAGSLLPYASWFNVYADPRDEFDADLNERMIQVDVYAKDMSEAVITGDKALGLFDGAVIAAPGIRPCRLQKGAVHGPMPDEADWRVTFELIVLVEDV